MVTAEDAAGGGNNRLGAPRSVPVPMEPFLVRVRRVAKREGVPPRAIVDALRRERLEELVPEERILALELPEPPSQLTEAGHWRAKAQKVKRLKREVWMAAVDQLEPFEEPPSRVRLHAHFRLWNLRDPWNLPGSLKAVIDALQSDLNYQDPADWRTAPGSGVAVYPDRGYILEDGDAEIGLVTQEVDRKDRGLRLLVEVRDAGWEPPPRVLGSR